MRPDPLFGTRREWAGYSFETTGYGSVERCGPSAHRVTIVHPADDDVLRLHHRLVRNGRLRPAWWRRLDASRVHVIDREELFRTRADLRGSWLSAAHAVARSCGEDDEVARMTGPALRQLLWTGRAQLDSPQVTAAFTELRRAADALVAERRRYRAAVDRWVGADLVQQDVESIRLEARVLAEVQREWDDTAV
jgi:hypothetical protein